MTNDPQRVLDKRPEDLRAPPNLPDYAAARAGFTWEAARAELDGLADGGLNMAHEAVHRHAAGPRRDHLALRVLRADDAAVDLSYGELAAQANRFASVLRQLGVARSERVFSLTGRIPELYAAALGTLTAGAVFCPLFSAFGPEPIRQRLELGDARVLVTTPRLYRRKVAELRDELDLPHVLVVGEADEIPDEPGVQDLRALMAAASPDAEVAPTAAEDMALLHFTSGTTGTPKGAVHVHDAVVAHHSTAKSALDLHPEDVFWCTADPGWVTGTSYGIVAPLTVGCTLLVDEAEFDAERWFRILAEERVTVWYTAPTAVRRIMRLGADAVSAYDISALRFVASVGEPLSAEAVLWGIDAFGLPIHDNWWQTETGGIMIANLAAAAVKPGSMGLPLPGVEAGILAADEEGAPVLDEDGRVRVLPDGETGILALRPGWPSMFRGYLHQAERYARCFVDGWYLSGDLAARDADGHFWFVGRADDVIKSAGHLVGPFEVESALAEHPSVAEAGVIGKPDPAMGAVVKAFVLLHDDVPASQETQRELLGFGRRRLGPAIAPREIAFVDELPKTRSGKIMRRLLKARELGLDEGDLSTLETPT